VDLSCICSSLNFVRTSLKVDSFSVFNVKRESVEVVMH
jgi:hypothetical protein